MITVAQIRAARALLHWSAADLAKESGLGQSTVRRMEVHKPATVTTLKAIQSALEGGGVQFVSEDENGGVGVRARLTGRGVK